MEHDLERLHPASFGWALGCCRRDRDEAEEVLQTVYLTVLEGKARFDRRSGFKTWLFAVIRRTAAVRRRRRWLRALARGRWVDGQPRPAPVRSPESLLGEAEASRMLVSALAALPRRQGEVLHLVFYQDLTIEEASRVLGVSVGTARRHYERGKESLRQTLSGKARP